MLFVIVFIILHLVSKDTISLHEAIVAEVAFFDIFDTALRIDELQKYLYRWDNSPSEDDIRAAVRGLDGMVRCHRGLYCLKDRDAVCEKRGEHQKRTDKLLRRVKLYCRFLKYVPFVRFVGVCNTVAFGAPDEQSDIDLFIVVKNDRMFMTRLLITALFQLFGVRRHGQQIARRFCLSFFVTQRGMDLHDIQLNRDDVYLYYWLRTMRPVLGNMKVYKRFLKLNGIPERFHHKKMLISGRRWNYFMEWLLGGYIGDFFEKMLGTWQKKRALKKKIALEDSSGIVISDDMLKFHNIDRRQEFYNRWQERVSACFSAQAS
jgi:hypothetical protein